MVIEWRLVVLQLFLMINRLLYIVHSGVAAVASDKPGIELASLCSDDMKEGSMTSISCSSISGVILELFVGKCDAAKHIHHLISPCYMTPLSLCITLLGNQCSSPVKLLYMTPFSC